MITAVLGAPGSGKSTPASLLVPLRPAHAVLDLDSFMEAAAAIAGRDIRRIRKHAPYTGTVARTDTASRLVAAPPDRVFAAFVDQDALTAWLPPDGMHGVFERFDARPGGSYRLRLTYADASVAAGKATADSDIVEARFVDIVPGVRVVQAVDFVSDDPAYAGTMTMTWEVTAVDAGTRVHIRVDDVPDGLSAEDRAA